MLLSVMWRLIWHGVEVTLLKSKQEKNQIVIMLESFLVLLFFNGSVSATLNDSGFFFMHAFQHSA